MNFIFLMQTYISHTNVIFRTNFIFHKNFIIESEIQSRSYVVTMTRSCDSYEARYFKMEDSERDVIEYYVNLGYSSEIILQLLECFHGIKISLRTLKKGFACLV